MSNNCPVTFSDYYSPNIYTWCTNCGNYGIHSAMKRALVGQKVRAQDTAIFFDIGCHGNGADKINGYRFHGLHGRVIPVAVGAKLANRRLTVIASGGDGATMNEGINHLIHAVRSNYDITFLLHNNSNFALTTGQASATTRQGVPMNSSPEGVPENTLHILNLVFSLEPTFVARAYSGNVKQLDSIIQGAIKHKGFSFIEIMQDCPTYNESTTHRWFMERVYDVSKLHNYDTSNLEKAKEIAKDISDQIATGILFQDLLREPFYDKLSSRQGKETELVTEVAQLNISSFLSNYR